MGTQKVSLTTQVSQNLMGSAGKAAGSVSDIASQVQVQTRNMTETQDEVVGLDGQVRSSASLASRIAGAGQDLRRYSDDLARGMDALNGQSADRAGPDADRRSDLAA